MTLARRVGGLANARRRIASYAVWEVAVFVLNVLAFVLIGLQLRGALSRVHGDDWRRYALCAGAVCAAVLLVRLAWIMSYTAALRWPFPKAPPGASVLPGVKQLRAGPADVRNIPCDNGKVLGDGRGAD